MIIPSFFGIGTRLIWRLFSQLALEVALSLFIGDERRTDPRNDSIASGQRETHNRNPALAQVPGLDTLPRLLKSNHIIGREPCRHTALVLPGLEANDMFRRIGSDFACFTGHFEQKAGRRLPVEVRGQNRAPFGRDELNVCPIAFEPEPHRVRIELRPFWPPRCCTRFRLWVNVASEGKKNGLAIIAQPRTELMCAAESLDSAIARLKHPGSRSARLHRPVRHSEG